MITKNASLNQMPGYPFDQEHDISRIAFFDIETTGLSADASYLYLIGCAYYKNSSFHIIQWFSEDIKEESLLLTAFFEFLKDFDLLIHYNGTGFDIPYLKKKILSFELEYSFDQLISIDLYKRLCSYKNILPLKNYRQKSIENFLGYLRTDIFDGGDLIQVYQGYLGKRHYELLWRKRNPGLPFPKEKESELFLHQLLLHNADDIRGLVFICRILCYCDLFEKPFRITETVIKGTRLHIHIELTSPLPIPIRVSNDLVELSAEQHHALISTQILEGELRHFYSNYKDYYYLPAEDCAIHKSVAGFVDKDFRQKAKPSNCYTRKSGLFTPQYDTVISPYFKVNYQDKLSFLEIHTDFLLQEEKLELYVKHLLTVLSKNKNH